jgi:thiol reductant ABC exporter CydC subunit
MTRATTVPTRPSGAIILAGLIGGAATASGIALTATSGWLIVRASERPVILTLLAAIVAVRAFGMARPYFRYVERVRSHDAALDDLARRRVDVYAGLVPLTPARLGRGARSEVLTGVVDDLSDVVDAQIRVTVPVVSSLAAGLLAVVLAAALAPSVGLVLAALLLVIAAGCAVAWLLESRSQDSLLAARADVMRVSDLVARQATELRAVGGEATALGWLAEAHDRLRSAVSRQSAGRALIAALTLVGTAAASVAAAFLARDSGVAGPIAALLVVTPVAVGDALAPLVESMRSLARAQGSQARLDALLDQEPAVVGAGATPLAEPDRGGVTCPVPHLTLRGVSGSWTGTSRQLAPVDLDLWPGRRVAVVGANGSGKSTLLAVLARHLDPHEGTYAVDGTDVHDVDLAELRERFAVVDDEPHVFSSTLRENLRLARPDTDDDAIDEALARAGLGAWRRRLPDGLDTRLGSGGRGLSGGERARLGLARALLSQRPVILLDEPVAHLDHATAMAVLGDVAASTSDRTVVMVSHRPEGLEGFDDILDLTAEHRITKE